MFTFLVVITIVCSLLGSVCIIFCVLSTIEKVQKRKAKKKMKEVERQKRESEKGRNEIQSVKFRVHLSICY